VLKREIRPGGEDVCAIYIERATKSMAEAGISQKENEQRGEF
jgi:hypothetical protein